MAKRKGKRPVIPDNPYINDSDEANIDTNEVAGVRRGKNDTTDAGKEEPSYEDTLETENQEEGEGLNDTSGGD
ncbi:hypothetical protein M1403_04020 [Patescibacteria group bacterium]|nr:hypothetical protein [Patescibacteria group bacterium]